MSDWFDLRSQLLQALANQIVVADSDFLGIDYRIHGRAQHVFLTHHRGFNQGSWIQVESGFADLDSEAIVTGIRHVGQPDSFGIGLGRIEDTLTIRWTSYVEGLKIDNLLTMVAAVANHADGLEADLTEEDSY
jgi:hypothetical protein